MDEKLNPKQNPIERTVYVSNLSFDLTNSDLNQIFSPFGRIVKVTIIKDTINADNDPNKQIRRSKGVAFVLYSDTESALNCVNQMNGTEVTGRIISCSIARDNGRSAQFDRRRDYTDKSRCYECGEFGHLSYNCINNLLGERVVKKRNNNKKFNKNKRKSNTFNSNLGFKKSGIDCDNNDVDEGEDPYLESLSAAIDYEQRLNESFSSDNKRTSKRRKFQNNSYFSDEEFEVESDD